MGELQVALELERVRFALEEREEEVEGLRGEVARERGEAQHLRLAAASHQVHLTSGTPDT